MKICRGTAGNSEDDDLNGSRRAPTVTNNENDDYELSRRAPTNREQFGKPVPGSIPTIIRSFKSAVSLRVNRSRNSPGVFHPSPAVKVRKVYCETIYEGTARHRCLLPDHQRQIHFFTDIPKTSDMAQSGYHVIAALIEFSPHV